MITLFTFLDRAQPFYPNENQIPNRFPGPSFPPRVLGSPSAQQESFRSSMTTNELCEEAYRTMLERHRRRRLCNEAHPELDVSAISLADIIMRANPMKKGTAFDYLPFYILCTSFVLTSFQPAVV